MHANAVGRTTRKLRFCLGLAVLTALAVVVFIPTAASGIIWRTYSVRASGVIIPSPILRYEEYLSISPKRNSALRHLQRASGVPPSSVSAYEGEAIE